MTHLSHEQLVLALDDELSGRDAEAVDDHLTTCPSCRDKYKELATLSVRLEQVMAGHSSAFDEAARGHLAAALHERERDERRRSKSRRFWALGWSTAALAAALVFVSVWRPRPAEHIDMPTTASANAGTFQAAGETFVALPYSNPDLPTSAPQIVQMRLPAASLAEAGIVLGPWSNGAAYGNRYVTADVVVGLDGEPRGVHVVHLD